jgi:hypothetical protein
MDTELIMTVHASAATHSGKHAASTVAAKSSKAVSSTQSPHVATGFSSALAKVTSAATHAKSVTVPKKA